MSKTRKALIFGVTGQDGSYLAEFLLNKGYEVHGARRRSSSFNTSRIDHLISDRNLWEINFFLNHSSLEDSNSIEKLISELLPDEIYNLAAQSHVGLSFEQPIYSSDIDGIGNLRILESIRNQSGKKSIKFYQASTSELFGGILEKGKHSFNEFSPLIPRSPYASAKLMAYWNTKIYREAYNLKTFNGILFNHESPRRGETFVTRKITRGLANIKMGTQECITLGNLYSSRDWGHAKDYVEAMWLMMQQDEVNDLVIATGLQFTVKDFIEKAAEIAEIKLQWKGKGSSEVGIDTNTDRVIIKVDPSYFRPVEVDYLLGDASLARKVIGWKPKVSFESLVNEMMLHDLKRAQIEINYPGSHRI
jgi:GDPmannose 4,6-dehydratase